MPPSKITNCRVCGSTRDVDRGRCETHRREFDAEKKRERAAKLRASMGEAAYLEYQRYRAHGRTRTAPKPKPRTAAVSQAPRADWFVPLEPFVAVQPITQRGRRIPGAHDSMVDRLSCPEWVAHFEREGSLGWARREAGL